MCSWENPVLAREFLDSSQIMEWLVDSFLRYVHKVFVIVSTNFELLLTWFDPPIIKFFKERGLKNRFWARAEFFLSPVKPTLVICCVGSTGELVFRVLGFLAFLLGCTGALAPRASVQPVNLHHLCLSAVLLVVPAYRSSSTSDQPVLQVVRFGISLDNSTGVSNLTSSV